MPTPTSPHAFALAARPWRARVSRLLFLLLVTLGWLLPAQRIALAQDEFPVTPATLDAPAEIAASPDLAARLVSNETRLIHLINLERAKVGAPPLRWNRELSEAARWFAKDRVDGTSPGCGHRDSTGDPAGARIRRFGYPGALFFGELIVCGYSEPDNSVFLWMSSANNDFAASKMLLDVAYREIGVAYYINPVTNKGFVVAKFATDGNYAPVIINEEAPSTESTNVNLHIYPTASPAEAIKISSDPTFAGAEWQPYVSNIPWTLPAGNGWRSVYVLTREASGKTSLASDVIWLGTGLQNSALSLDQASSIGIGYAMDALPPSDAESVRFSLGWELDNDDGSILVYRGAAEQVIDENAVGGTALRMRAGERETLARAILPDIPRGRILTAFFRLKTDAAPGADSVILLRVQAGANVFGPIAVRANQFKAMGAWQEFGVNFVLEELADAGTGTGIGADDENTQVNGPIELQWAHDGAHTVFIDSVRVYSQGLPNNGRVVWQMEPGSARNMGVQARFDGSTGLGDPFDIAYSAVDALAPLDQGKPALEAKPGRLVFTSAQGTVTSPNQLVVVCDIACGLVGWSAVTESPWLRYIKGREGLLIDVDPSGLTKGAYQGMILLSPVIDQAVSAGFERPPTPQLPGEEASLLQTWIDVQLLVDGADGLPPREVTSINWLPITQQ